MDAGPKPQRVCPDKTVAVIKFETPEGQPIAAYIDYAMHPVNGYLAGFTSADFAGATSRWVEQAYGDKMVAVFAQGASGDQNPLYLRAATNALASRERRAHHRQRAYAGKGRSAPAR